MIKIIAMPRPRSQFYDYWNASKDSVVEHITKLVMYSEARPNDIRGWKVTLNKYLNRLRTYNVSKKGVHYSEEYLLKDFSYEFTIAFTQTFCDEAEEDGYPPVVVEEKNVQKMIDILNQFCHQVFVPNGRLS